MQIKESPTQEIMAYALKDLTKDWSEEEQISFSKKCFDHVVQERFHKLGKYPELNIQVNRS